MGDDSLGTEEITSEKMGMFVFYLIVFTFLIFGLIGAIDTKGSVFNLLTLYILFFAVIGIIPVAIDNLTKGERDLPLDTVTFDTDDEAILPLSMKWQIVIGIAGSIFLGFFILSTGQSFLAPFRMQIFETTIGEAILSGVVGGVVEVATIFGVLFAISYFILTRMMGLFGSILSLIAISLVFTGFHSIVYEYNSSALISVFIFGLFFQAIPLYLFRSVVIPIMLHFTNNFIIVLFASSVSVGLVL